MYYEEQVIQGVLHYRSTPTGDWIPMSAERLTAMLLESRQRAAASPALRPQPLPMAPLPVFTQYPQWTPAAPPCDPLQPPYTVTCGGSQP